VTEAQMIQDAINDTYKLGAIFLVLKYVVEPLIHRLLNHMDRRMEVAASKAIIGMETELAKLRKERGSE
jgi:hypothetical protein